MQTTQATDTAAPAAPMAHPAPKFVSIPQAAKLRPAFSVAALRALRFNAFDRVNSRGMVVKGNNTGPAGVWLEVGAKVLIDLDAFDRWLESHRITSGRT